MCDSAIKLWHNTPSISLENKCNFNQICRFERWTIRHGSNIFGQLTTTTSTIAFLHPNFRTGVHFNENDIGVVLLPNPIGGSKIDFSKMLYIISNLVHLAVDVLPISLPQTDVALPRQYEEGQITNFETNLAEPSLGFTPTAILRSAFLTVFPNALCENTFPNITATTFCAFDDHYLSNLCTGDRGTAFVVVFRGADTLVRQKHSSFFLNKTS